MLIVSLVNALAHDAKRNIEDSLPSHETALRREMRSYGCLWNKIGIEIIKHKE